MSGKLTGKLYIGCVDRARTGSDSDSFFTIQVDTREYEKTLIAETEKKCEDRIKK